MQVMPQPSITEVNTPQSRCQFALAWADITPPIGIYHRMWGAAKHERATGVLTGRPVLRKVPMKLIPRLTSRKNWSQHAAHLALATAG